MYNALQAVFQKAPSHGLQYQVSYTYGKCMTNNSGYYGTWSNARASNTASPYWQNIYDPKAEWSPCYYDETHNLTSYAVYELPFGKGKKFGRRHEQGCRRRCRVVGRLARSLPFTPASRWVSTPAAKT